MLFHAVLLLEFTASGTLFCQNQDYPLDFSAKISVLDNLCVTGMFGY